MDNNKYFVFQEGNFAESDSYGTLESAENAARDVLLRAVAEHSLLDVYVCKAVLKFSPKQLITVIGEKLD